jgi:hypothetical protein
MGLVLVVTHSTSTPSTLSRCTCHQHVAWIRRTARSRLLIPLRQPHQEPSGLARVPSLEQIAKRVLVPVFLVTSAFHCFTNGSVCAANIRSQR